MKQKGKKVIAVLLACVLLVCQVPQQVSAVEMEAAVNDNLPEKERDRNKTKLPESEKFSNQDKAITEQEQSSETAKPEQVSASEGQMAKAENAFYYEQEFAKEGVKVVLSAREGVVPDNCNVEVMLLKEETLETLKDQIREEMQGMIDQGILRSETGSQSVFDKYYDLRAETEQAYAVDVKITYMDEVGNFCVFEPKEKDAVTVSMQIGGLKENAEDEMHSVELFYMPESETDDSRGRSVQTEHPEYLTERTAIDGDIISFDAEHFSIYTVAIIKYAAYASPQMIAAEEKAWNLINNHADPNYFLNDPYKEQMTAQQYKELRQEAVKATKGCSTQYEKIKAITGLVAGEIYYDYYYYNGYLGGNNDVTKFINPFDVWKHKRTTCGGYAYLMRTMLISIGIPCMYLRGRDHAYNAAYDSTNKKWIFADSTWCSKNKYSEEKEYIKGGYSYKYFDMSIEQIAALSNHEVQYLEGLLAKKTDSVYYRMDSDHDLDYNYDDMVWSDRNWHLQVLGVKGTPEKITVCAGFEGFEVHNIHPSAFFENKKLKTVDLSKTKIQSIREDSFGKCSRLTDVKFPSSLQTIERYSFRECPKLQTVDLSKTKLQEVRDKVFFSCSGLTTVKLPKSLQNIDLYAFGECKKLTSINLSKTNVETIGDSAFRECSSLANVKFPSSLKKIGQRAFQECLKLKKVDLSKTSVESINRSAFYMCDSLISVKCSASLKELGWYVFSTCRKLKTADLSKTKVTKTSLGLFVACRSLESVKLPKNITEIGEKSFAGCIKLKTLDLSKTKLKKISKRAYFDCFSVKLIKLPSTVNLIEEEAFTATVSTPLDTIVVTPLSAKKIGYTKAKAGIIWPGRKVSVCTYAYKIKFDKNGAQKGSMKGLTCGGGIKTTLPANKFKRAGYKFMGWNTKKNGKGTAVADQGTIKKFARKDNAVVTLYAQWKKVK